MLLWSATPLAIAITLSAGVVQAPAQDGSDNPSQQDEAREQAREDRIDGHIEAADNLRKAGKYEAALEEVAKALELDPEHSKAQRLREKIVEDQTEAKREAVQDQVDALIDQAEEAIKEDQFERAFQLERQAREAADGAFNEELAQLRADIIEAEREFNIEKNEQVIDSLVERAESQLDAGRYDDAIQTAQSVFEYDRENQDAQNIITKANEEKQEAALNGVQQEIDSKINRAEALLERGRTDEAEALFQEVLTQDPENRDARKGLEEVADIRQEAAEAGREAREQVEEAAQEAREEVQQAAPQPRTPTPTVTPTPVPQQMDNEDAAEQASEAEEQTRREAERRAEEEREAAERRAEEERKRQEEMAEQAEREREAAARAAEEERERMEEQRQEQQEAIRQQAERAFEEGVTLYDQGELARARQRWLDSKQIDPTFTKADAFLEETEEEYNELLANQAALDDFERREAEALEKMNTLIAMSTDRPLVLPEFLNTLRLFSGIDFVIAGQVDARVEAAFEDEPLNEVLDAVLTPIGLRWERQPGTDRVVITPDLRTEVFPVLPQTLNTVDSLIDRGVIQRLLYGPNGEPPLEGQEILTDPRQNVVIVTDSEPNVEKFRRFLEGLKGTESAQLIFKSFEIDERRAPQIKALLDAILSVDDDAPFNPERKLILEGSTLIIKDTPENVQKVEQTLQDEQFLSKFYENTLDVATFNLTPILSFEENEDLARSFADQVRQVVETLLYGQIGRSKAEAEGRRLFYDPATMQLTVVDFPDRLETVQNYIEGLPQIANRRRSKIIFLDWATASDLAGQIESFIGGDGGTTTQASGDSVTKSLSVEDEIEFRGAVFRLLNVEANDLNDDTDDEIEIYFRSGTNDEEQTIEWGRSATFEDFQVVVDDISPSNTPGEGRARITIEFIAEDEDELDEDEDEAEEEEEEVEQEGLSIVPVENLNALFISYDDIEDLREVEFWVETLDIPTLQVSIEIKFVEVVTSRAKQFKSRFNIGDLTEDQTFSDSVLRSRFAEDRDEFTSPFEQAVESTDSANLLKGTTVFDFIVNNGASPISVELRMLEAQGLINVVNGPTVTVLNNVSATFEIERQFGIPTPQEGATAGDENNLTAVAGITPVDLDVTPNVTRAGNIQMTIDVEIRDFDQNLGQPITQGIADDEEAVTTAGLPRAFSNTDTFGVLRKQLETEVRIRDGGTVVLGGWRSERTDRSESGVPILRDIPFVGPLLFNRFQNDEDKITLLIFLTGQVVRD